MQTAGEKFTVAAGVFVSACLIVALLLLPVQARAGEGFVADPSFGGDGLVTGRVGPLSDSSVLSPEVFAKDSRGRVIVGGASGAVWQVRRLLPNGDLDPTFGIGGEATVSNWSRPTWDDPATLTSAVIRPDGRILLVGFHGSGQQSDARTGDAWFVMKQLLPNGSPDPTFGSSDGGKTFSNYRGAVRVALRPDGSFLVAAFKQLRQTGRTDDAALYGFTESGRLIKDFGGSENTDSVNVPGSPGNPSNFFDVDVLADGRILVTGAARGRLLLMRLREDGTRDPSFARGGQASLLPDGSGYIWVARDTEVDEKGRILVTGFAAPRDPARTGYGLVLRFLRSGRLDRSFADRGIARLYATPRSGPRSTRLYDVTIDSKGGIWVTGSRGGLPRQDREAIAVRLLPNGSKDRSFFRNGILPIRLGEASVGSGTLRVGRKIYMSGRYDQGNQERFFLKRLVVPR